MSSNQSPVLKFYNLSYPDDFEQRLETYSGALSPVRGIQLWQDWNLQVRDWARSHPQILEYHSIRSEELIGQDTRWDHWQQMADIVGFSESTDLLCCLSKSQTKDYGKSASIHNPDDIRHAFPNGKVHGRRRLLENENEKQSSPQDPIILIGDFAKWEYQLSKLKEQEELTTETRVTFLEMGNDLLKRYQATTNLVDRPYYLKYIQDKLDELASSQIVMETDTLEQLATDYKGWVLRQENIKPNDLKNVTVLEEFRSNGKSIWRRFKKFQASNQIVPKDAVDILKVLNLLTTLQNQIDTAMKQQQLKYRQPTDQQDIYKKLEETILKQRAATVQQRYGKWQRILADKPKLSEHLHREGEKALKIFGYEPFVPSNTSTFSTNAGFLCTASVICAMHNS